MKINCDDPRLIEGIHAFKESGEEKADLKELGISLLRIRATIPANEKVTLTRVYGDRFTSGLGAICFTEPCKINVNSIVSGFRRIDRMCTGAGLDVSYWNANGKVLSYDFGCFSNLAPLAMEFEALAGDAELDLIIVGETLDLFDDQPLHELTVSPQAAG